MDNAYDQIINNHGKKTNSHFNSIFGHRSLADTAQKTIPKTSEKRSSSLRRSDKPLGSVPLILPPPRVEAKQIKQSTVRNDLEQARFTADNDSSNHDEESLHDDFSGEIEYHSMEEKESANMEDFTSTQEDATELFDEFSSMLSNDYDADQKEESPYIQDESSSDQDDSFSLTSKSSPDSNRASQMTDDSTDLFEESNITDDSADLFEESNITDDSADLFEEYNITDDSADLFEESNLTDDSSDLFEEFYAMLDDPSDDEGVSSSSDYDEYSAMLEPSSSVHEVVDLLEESSSHPIEPLHSVEEREEEFLSDLENQSFFQDESSSSHEIYDRNHLFVEESEEDSHDFEIKHECKDLPTVMLPVLVGSLDIEIDIFDCFPVNISIEKLTKLEWSVDSLDSHVLLPSNTVFLKGILIADIEYVKDTSNHTLHALKLPVAWSKTTKVEWLYPPEFPTASSRKEFMFEAHDGEGLSSHFESKQEFSKQIESQLKCINFVWHEELKQTPNSGLEVQGRAVLCIDLLQEQYIDLHSGVSFL